MKSRVEWLVEKSQQAELKRLERPPETPSEKGDKINWIGADLETLVCLLEMMEEAGFISLSIGKMKHCTSSFIRHNFLSDGRAITKTKSDYAVRKYKDLYYTEREEFRVKIQRKIAAAARTLNDNDPG